MEIEQNGGLAQLGELATKRDPVTTNTPVNAPDDGTEMDVDPEPRQKVDSALGGDGAHTIDANATNNANLTGSTDENDHSNGLAISGTLSSSSRSSLLQVQQGHGQGQGQVPVQVQAQVVTPTLASGCSVGTQSDKVTDLGPETAVLSVGSKNHVTHVCWNPKDPTLLAAGGDALCRIWLLPTSTQQSGFSRSGAATMSQAGTFSTTTAESGSKNDVNSTLTPHDTIDLPDVADNAIITAMSWSPDGESLAVATHPKQPGVCGNIYIRSKSGESLDELPAAQDWVLSLLWNSVGTALLGVTHSDNTNSVLMAWDVTTARVVQPLSLARVILDVSWLDHRSFVLCGPQMIASTAINENSFEPPQERQGLGQHHNHHWSSISFDAPTRTTALVSENSGLLGLLDSGGNFHSTLAHDGEITAMAYQPLPNPDHLPENNPRILATAATDGSIKLWDALRPFEIVHTLDLGGSSPVLAMSFTPDGYLVAAASRSKILFWNAEIGGLPRASWTGKGVIWQPAITNGEIQTNGSATAEDDDAEMTDDDDSTHTLSWDANGRKVAYGVKDNVSTFFIPRMSS